MLGRALVWLATLLGFIVGLLVVLALLGFLHLYSTPSASMEPTLLCARPGPGCTASENDRVAVLKYIGFAPGRGDLVAFHTPRSAVVRCGAGGTFVKRIIAVPGDRVGEAAGSLFVNGARIVEPYVPAAERDSQSFKAIAVPQGSYYVVGDNRRSSCDSRAWGFVPRGSIVGRVVATYWPWHRISLHR
jgi:signal peptidase I